MPLRALLFPLLLAALSCAGTTSDTVCRPDPVTGSERCQHTGGAPEAAVTGGMAAGLWAAKGCTINGCEPPFTCNTKTKLCERQACSEAVSCPPGYECSGDLVCR